LAYDWFAILNNKMLTMQMQWNFASPSPTRANIQYLPHIRCLPMVLVTAGRLVTNTSALLQQSVAIQLDENTLISVVENL
jgi:hypothetical protein